MPQKVALANKPARSSSRSKFAARSEPAQKTRSATSLLAELGLIGFSSIEPVVLAALASGEPLLLIGPHGTAKSYLLTRIAEALGLEWRHYNASLLNFDDLVGYPLPGDDGSLRYVQTPSSIWGAEAVFFDEISRCRVDLQNKLFPIIHEKRVQGVELTKLVYRWSAMNPPPTDDDAELLEGYRGSEPLDPALADRFAFVIQMPRWDSFCEDDQVNVIRAADQPPSDAGAAKLRCQVEAIRRLLPEVRNQLDPQAAVYVRVIMRLLCDAGLELSPRRGGILLRNIVAVHAGRLLREPAADPAESALLALIHSIPQRAIGLPVDELKLLAAHREAWQLAGLQPTDPRRIILLETDPLLRALRATELGEVLSQEEFSAIVADALAALPNGGRHALARALFESGAAARLVASVADQCGALYGIVAVPQETTTSVRSGDARHRTWQRITQRLARQRPENADTTLMTNLLVGLFESNELVVEEDVDRALRSWQKVRGLIEGKRR